MNGRKASPHPAEKAAATKEPAKPSVPVKAPEPAKPAIKRGVYVFLADDEPDQVNYDGDPVKIAPGSTEIKGRGKHPAKVIAEHIVATIGSWGACVTAGPVVDGQAALEEDQPKVDAAKRQYLVRTSEWAQEIVREAFHRNQPYLAAGLVRREEKETTQAKAWLAAHEADLRKAGLIG